MTQLSPRMDLVQSLGESRHRNIEELPSFSSLTFLGTNNCHQESDMFI